MATVSMKIMAHPTRSEEAHLLAEKTKLSYDDIVWDEKNERWDTGKRAWQAIDLDADWGVVVQDDAIPCLDLLAGLEEALDHVPEETVVSGYVGTLRPMPGYIKQAGDSATTTGATWIQTDSLNWGVLIGLPTHAIEPMLAKCDTDHRWPNYDKRIGVYYRDALEWPTWNTWPSLVDHPPDGSIVNHGSGRVARNFIGEDVSALDVKWNGQAATARGSKHPASR